MAQEQEKRGNFYGRVFANVMRNPEISTTAKAIYAYLSVLCGAGDECFPSVQTICTELNISRDTFYRNAAPLIARGIVEKTQSKAGRGRFGPCVYRLKDRDQPCTVFADTAKTADGPAVNGETGQTVSEISDSPSTDNLDSKEKQVKKNQLKKKEEEIINLFNKICTSFPRVVKLSDSRRRAISARFKDGYTAEDFKKMFELAENSPFLRGENARGWRATFDWLIADRNMTRVLEGVFSDQEKPKESGQQKPAAAFYDQYLKERGRADE